MQRLNDFILAIPFLFLMKVPYLWLPAVMFYSWPPVVSAILCVLILLGLLAMNWQNSAWIEKAQRELARDPNAVYVEFVRPPLIFVARNALFVLALSAACGWVLNGFFGFPGLQWGIFSLGFIAMYKKALFFGRRTTYILTDRGLGIRYVPQHIDYRLLIRFNEIRSVQKIKVPAKRPIRWSTFAATGQVKEALLLTPKNVHGFSPQFAEILLASDDLDNLIQKFPPSLVLSPAA